MRNNYYVILGVGSDATPEEIRSAYRHLALQLHPDLSGSDAEPFLNLQEAYKVLSDPAQRELYDDRLQARPKAVVSGRHGVEPLRARPRAEPMRAAGTAPVHLFHSFETYEPSFEELFERFWSNFEPVTRPKAEQIKSLTVEVPLSLDQAASGGMARLLIPARAACPTCSGHGAVGPYECWRCSGQGSLTADYPLEVAYPPGIINDYAVQVPLQDFGIDNFYLVVLFRVTAAAY